jgi:hypothetical protein
MMAPDAAKETLIKSPVRPELVEGHKPEALNIGVLIGVWFDRLTTNGLNKCFPNHRIAAAVSALAGKNVSMVRVTKAI